MTETSTQAERVAAARDSLGNFNSLRLFAVLMVIYGNGYILTRGLAPGLWGEPFASVGLHLLFAASGYLWADSWDRDPNWFRYVAKRVLRLLPGLIAAVLVTVLVIGPLATKLSLRFYLLNGQTIRYLLNTILMQQLFLPRVFEGQEWNGAVNPMLWTLLAGGVLAGVVPLAAALPGRQRPLILFVLSLVLGGLSWFLAGHPEYSGLRLLRLDVRPLLSEAPLFFGGMLWQHLGRDGRRWLRTDIAVLCFLTNWVVASWRDDWAPPLLWLTLPYMVACFGPLSAPVLRRSPNIAYGAYLIAFPLQQLIVALAPKLAHPVVACSIGAVLYGAGSRFLAERPALRAQSRLAAAAGAPSTAGTAGQQTEAAPTASAASVGSSRNNFDALRVFAALLVIYGHGRELVGGRDPGLWGVPLARIGLDIFFAISGYLVTTSWERDARPHAFLLKRALRIFPGLIVCVVGCAFVLGPAVSTMQVGEYMSMPATYTYLANIALYFVQKLPGVFTDLRYEGTVNGSLWSLFPEWLCYLTVPLFGALNRQWRLRALLVGALACGSVGVLMFLIPPEDQIVFYGASLHYVLVELPLFFVGGLLALVRTSRQVMGRPDLCLLFLTLNYGLSTWFGWWSLPVEWLTLPYIVVSVGQLSLPVLDRAASLGDMSYGLYLYGFPLQQTLLYAMPAMPAPLATCAALAALLGLASWHLVEKWALRFKPVRNRNARVLRGWHARGNF